MKRKIVKILILILCCIMAFSVISLADVKDFSGKITGEGANSSRGVIVKIIATSLNTIRIVGIAVAVVMLMVVACKYIVASAGDKADIKKYDTNYIIGALVLFGASGIITIAKNFVEGAFKEN